MTQTLLADVPLEYTPFEDIDACLDAFSKKSFSSLSERKKFSKINERLLQYIQNAETPCFLLASVLDYIRRVNVQKLLSEPYRLINFEFWLNHFSLLSFEENSEIRQKIAGKMIPRDEYQAFFPIGTSKLFYGSHFVAAHLAPDIDTTIASFWGWLDAFCARVGSSLHQWSLPGTLQDSHTQALFHTLFGSDFFELTVRPTPVLSLTALDLLSQKDIVKVSKTTKSTDIDHSMLSKPIIVTDDSGHFLGNWRSFDAEAVRQVVVVFYSLISWLENTIHETIISSFAKSDVIREQVRAGLEAFFATPIKASLAVKEYSERQKKQLHDFLKKVLGLTKGSQSSFSELVQALNTCLNRALCPLELIDCPTLYDKTGRLVEDRPQIFRHLEKVFKEIDGFLDATSSYVDQLEVLLTIKDKVLAIPSVFITAKSEVEEIRKKMEPFDHLPVLVDDGGKPFVVGVVYASDIKQQVLGSVSLRDFSNEQEMKMASYLQVISVIDHHKTDINTPGVSTLVISDAQSSNTIIASVWMAINDRYSLLGRSKESIELELNQALKEPQSDIQKIKRLLQLSLNGTHAQGHSIDPRREFAEYLCFLHAILDDTDLLTKVTRQDLVCVANLLNRMKSISLQKDSLCVELEDIRQSPDFVPQARLRILQNEDMYSIYSNIYAHKEKEVEYELEASVQGRPSALFSDTKEQNGCARVGQIKLFPTNIAYFSKHQDALRALWLRDAKKINEVRPQIDLHMQMISTVAGAEDVKQGRQGRQGRIGTWTHKDELWIWTAPTSLASEHLINFLNAFQASELVQKNSWEVYCLGPNRVRMQEIFSQNFPIATRKTGHEKDFEEDFKEALDVAIIRFTAGLLNSRKACVSPFLPRFMA